MSISYSLSTWLIFDGLLHFQRDPNAAAQVGEKYASEIETRNLLVCRVIYLSCQFAYPLYHSHVTDSHKSHKWLTHTMKATNCFLGCVALMKFHLASQQRHSRPCTWMSSRELLWVKCMPRRYNRLPPLTIYSHYQNRPSAYSLTSGKWSITVLSGWEAGVLMTAM